MNNLLIFGTGNNAERIARYIDKTKNRIMFFVDNDSDKWGKEAFGRRVIAPDKIPGLQYDCIVVASCHWKEIRAQLLSLGVNRKKILCPLAPIGTKRFQREYHAIYNVMGKFNFFYKKWHLKEQFNPDFIGMFTNPYFFSRKKLYENIGRHSHYMHGSCMDFGCGVSPYRKLLPVDKYVGVEIEMDDKQDGIVYYDGHKLPFPDGEFDSVISSEVFEHISNIEEILIELHRVLKAGGAMLLTVPFAYPKHCWPSDYRRYTDQGIKNLLSDAGFECVEYSAGSGYWECLAQLKNVYWEEEVQTKTGAGLLIKKMVIALNNLSGVLADKMLPYSDKIYLDNVIVVKKRAGG